MHYKKFLMTFLAVAGLMLAPLTGFSADDPNLARMWVVTPKAGMDDQLEEALKAHNAWRVENKDPWSWNTYHTVTGDGLGAWYIRSPGHSYADFDAYGDSEFSKNAYKHWMENVDQYVETYRGHLAEFAPEISHWPEDAGPYDWFWVYDYHLKPGGGRPYFAAVKAITDALREAGWDEVWSFVWQLDGDVPAISLVIPEKNWAGFAGPETGAYDTIAESMGKEKADAMWGAMFEQIESATSTIYHRHPDMSFEGASQ